MPMEINEQKIIDAMSQLEKQHQKIVERKLAVKAKEGEEAAARKAILNKIDSVETQIRTIDALQAQHINDRTRDAADNILLDSTKPNRERDALAQLLALVRHRIDTRNAYVRFGSLFLFFLLYSSTVLVQRDVTTAFGVESRLQVNAL